MLVIGIGAGHPDHLTLQAVKAMNEVDVFFIPDKGAEKEALGRLRLEMIDRHVRERSHRRVAYGVPQRTKGGDYQAAVADWHDALETVFSRLILEELGDGETGAFLVWGDPALYDSTIRILARLAARPGLAFDYEIIPGISSVQALAAAHKVALNAIGRSVLISNGRQSEEGFPDNADSLVIMLNAEKVIRQLDGELEVYWGANLGLDGEALVAGSLKDVRDDIERKRAETRAAQGWVMDVALVKRLG